MSLLLNRGFGIGKERSSSGVTFFEGLYGPGPYRIKKRQTWANTKDRPSSLGKSATLLTISLNRGPVKAVSGKKIASPQGEKGQVASFFLLSLSLPVLQRSLLF